jgi:TonB family protein
MKKYILVMAMIAGCGVVYSQPSANKNLKVVMNSEPAYPQGEQALYDAVMHSVSHSDEAIEKLREGEVSMSFDIKPDSTVTNAKILKGVGQEVDEEVKRFVETLKFAPAIQNGKAVKMNVMYTFSVRTVKD